MEHQTFLSIFLSNDCQRRKKCQGEGGPRKKNGQSKDLNCDNFDKFAKREEARCSDQLRNPLAEEVARETKTEEGCGHLRRPREDRMACECPPDY
jgi:hypothetical protein